MGVSPLHYFKGGRWNALLDDSFELLSLNPTVWYDAADSATITESSGDVSEWRDKSGNGVSVVQATGAHQPKTGTRTQNGLNVLDFDGSDDRLTSTFAISAVRTSRIYSLFVVGKSDRTNQSSEGFFSAIAGGFDFQTGWIMERRTTNLALHYGRGDATNNFAQNSVANSSTSPMLMFQTVDGPAGTFQFQINEATQTTTRTDGSLGASGFMSQGTASHTLHIGRRAAGDPLDGWIGEVILFNKTLTASEKASVYKYLNGKWNLY